MRDIMSLDIPQFIPLHCLFSFLWCCINWHGCCYSQWGDLHNITFSKRSTQMNDRELVKLPFFSKFLLALEDDQWSKVVSCVGSTCTAPWTATSWEKKWNIWKLKLVDARTGRAWIDAPWSNVGIDFLISMSKHAWSYMSMLYGDYYIYLTGCMTIITNTQLVDDH